MSCLIRLVSDVCVTRTWHWTHSAYMHLNMQQLNSNLNEVCTSVCKLDPAKVMCTCGREGWREEGWELLCFAAGGHWMGICSLLFNSAVLV